MDKRTGLSGTGQLLTDSFWIDGSHTDGVFRVGGQLGKQDAIFLPTDVGLIMGKKKKKALSKLTGMSVGFGSYQNSACKVQLIKSASVGGRTHSLGPASRCGHIGDAVVLDWTRSWIPPGVQTGGGFIIHDQVGGRGVGHWKSRVDTNRTLLEARGWFRSTEGTATFS